MNAPDWWGRIARLRKEAGSLDAVVVSTQANIFYLTGFRGTSGLLVIGAEQVTLLVDGRYEGAVRAGIEAGALAAVRPGLVEARYETALANELRRLGARRAAFEAAQVTVAVLQDWRKAAPEVEWLPTERLVEVARVIKDEAEIEILRRGGRLIAGVIARLPELLAAGRSEREVARAIDTAMDRAGFAQPSFPTIVASGPNSAHPHASPTDRHLGAGDLVVLDFGGTLDGYCTDVTRMACVGPARPQAAALLEAVVAAHAAAVNAVRAGVACTAVDAAARVVLEHRGLGQAFLHGTGHGLGLDVHEAPRLGRQEAEPPEHLQAGMVCTIEPGAYLEGVGGVRVEDDVLVTADGCEVLTEAPRGLLVV